jgi:hypothetical protein
VNEADDDELEELLRAKHVLFCKWRTCFLWTLGILSTIALIAVLVIFLWLVPHTAQQSARDTSMVHTDVVIYAIDVDSLRMNATMILENAGSHRAVIKRTRASVHTRFPFIDPATNKTTTKFGELELPEIRIAPNKASAFNISTLINLTSIPALKRDVGRLLTDIDVKWYIVCRPTITVHFGGSTVNTKVHSNNTVLLRGTKLANMHASNLTVVGASETQIYAFGQMTMASSADFTLMDRDSDAKDNDTMVGESSLTRGAVIGYDKQLRRFEVVGESAPLLTFTMHDLDTDVVLGYATVPNLVLTAGLNTYEKVNITLERSDENEDMIATVLTKFMQKQEQTLGVSGPSAHYGRETCIDGTMRSTVRVAGSTASNTAIAGLVTAESMTGWDVNKTYSVQGAYSTMLNTLNVPIRIKRMDSYLTLEEGFAYDVDIKVGFFKYKAKCNYSEDLAHMHSGRGMFKDDPDLTFVDIGALESQSMYSIGEPIPGQYGYPNAPSDFCQSVGGEQFGCCFLFSISGAACYANPKLWTDPTDEVEQPYIDTHMGANITATLDGKYDLTLRYYQDFFPVYFGSGVVEGYPADYGVSCSSYTFYSKNESHLQW